LGPKVQRVLQACEEIEERPDLRALSDPLACLANRDHLDFKDHREKTEKKDSKAPRVTKDCSDYKDYRKSSLINIFYMFSNYQLRIDSWFPIGIEKLYIISYKMFKL
jgi:hypothetical protein